MIPEPHWLNQRTAALSCGVSTKSFAEWRVEPCARIGKEVFYTVADIVQNRLSRQLERFNKTVDDAPSSLDREAAERERTLLTRKQGTLPYQRALMDCMSNDAIRSITPSRSLIP